jgi:hypothetical protein
MTPAPIEPPPWLLAGFPIFFVMIWLSATALMGLFTNWYALQAQFPRNDDPPLLRLHMQSGRMGWVGLNNVLTFDACRSGLRVGIWRIFGLFQRPFQVPWDQIEAEPVTFLLVSRVRLGFGRPATGTLVISPIAWQRLKAAQATAGRPTR